MTITYLINHSTSKLFNEVCSKAGLIIFSFVIFKSMIIFELSLLKLEAFSNDPVSAGYDARLGNDQDT